MTADDALQKLDRLDREISQVWHDSPLAFRKAVLADTVRGYGDYDKRDNNVFSPGARLRVYVEPVGYGYAQANGRYSLELGGDLSIESEKGQILAEGKDLFSVKQSSGAKIREFHMVLSFEVPEIKPGEYLAVFRIKDLNSDKQGSFSVSFRVES